MLDSEVQPEIMLLDEDLLPYRFWHGEWQRMYAVYSIRVGWVEIHIRETNRIVMVPMHSGTLMRYTNQDDADGTRIYEGDIVFNDKAGVTCEIVKINHASCMMDGKKCLQDLPFVMSEWKRIGDIFTSPHLRP